MTAVSDDRERVDAKRLERQRKRDEGGTYLELGPSGGIVYSEWTCEWCTKTLKNTHGTPKAAIHTFQCEARPHADQTGLEQFT